MTTSNITLHSADGDFSAYLALPDGADAAHRYPGIVLLQEIFGVNENMQAVAEGFASDGFVAIAPDLFWRQEPGVKLNPAAAADRDRATELMKGLDQRLAVADALVAADHIRSLAGSNGHVGAVGYCLGGKLAYLLAMEPGIDAAVSYYGVAIQGALDRAPEIRSPLLLHIANDDHLCPPEAQEAIRKALLARADFVTIVEHPGTSHAFARTGGQNFDAAAAARANAETGRFLRAALER